MNPVVDLEIPAKAKIAEIAEIAEIARIAEIVWSGF
jgi:hypothetical protein